MKKIFAIAVCVLLVFALSCSAKESRSKEDLVKDARAQYNAEKYVKAMQLYKQAVEAGDASSAFAIGLMYAEGEGIARNYDLAEKWFKKADEMGTLLGRVGLISLYCDPLYENNHLRNLKKARSMALAIENEDNDFIREVIGRLYFNALGTDYAKARKLFSAVKDETRRKELLAELDETVAKNTPK